MDQRSANTWYKRYKQDKRTASETLLPASISDFQPWHYLPVGLGPMAGLHLSPERLASSRLLIDEITETEESHAIIPRTEDVLTLAGIWTWMQEILANDEHDSTQDTDTIEFRTR